MLSPTVKLIDNATGKARQNVCKRQGLFTNGITQDNLSMTRNFHCIVFLEIFEDNATFFAVVVSSHGKHVPVMPNKQKCVFPVTDRPQVLATDANFFTLWFCFFTINSSRRKKAFSFKSIFVATYIKANFTKSSKTICFCSVRVLQITCQLRSNC